MHYPLPRLIISGILALVLLALVPARSATAADERCFPETGQCLSGRFREFWEQNGGLAVFGYPITRARQEPNRDTGRLYLTQWFERNRFELHPENRAPYDVLLGRLGDDRLLQQGVAWQELRRESGRTRDCLWFPQTGHNVCDQAAGVGFKSYWQSHGLADPRLGVHERSLALFGLPLTEPRVETNASGDRVLTQVFERGRFEYHPNKPAEFKVLLGLVGTELQSWQSVTWEGLRVPMPPVSTWTTHTGTGERINGAPVQTQGAIGYPITPAPVERPIGPFFKMLRFQGTLDAWLQLERRNSPSGNPIDEKTVRDTTVAGRPARRYQHVVTGTGDGATYAVDLEGDRLLLILTEDLDNETYRRVITELALAPR